MSDLYSAPWNYFECKFASKSDEVLLLEPICQNIDFRYKIWKRQHKIRAQRLQIDYTTNLILKPFFVRILILMVFEWLI